MQPEKIQILNIPNFYCSFYIKVLSEIGHLVFSGSSSRFSKFDFQPVIIFTFRSKLIVIDNNDPVGIDEDLFEKADFYFATNKLTDDKRYSRAKIFPLFPHYPIDVFETYFGLFFLHTMPINWIKLLRETVRIWKRPRYKSHDYKERKGNFVFFSGSIWKKEKEANLARAEFIKYCQESKLIDFEGGFIPRNDGENQGFDELLNSKIYSPKKFNRLIQQSVLGFNNPAVLGAVSWRFAEYLNTGVPLVSLPFKIDLPVYPQNGEEILMISDKHKLKDQLEEVLTDLSQLQKIGKGGKAYFERHCTVKQQAEYLKALILK